MSDRDGIPVSDDDIPPALRHLTFIDYVLRFVIGAVPAFVVMLGLSPLLEAMPTELFFIVAAVAACTSGVACVAWGDRFLVSFLRAIGRVV